MSLLRFPNELLLIIAKNLKRAKDVNSFIRTTRNFVYLLTPILEGFAVQDWNGRGALHNAIQKGQLPLVRLLLEKKHFDINLEDAGMTALCEAARSGSIEIIEFLFRKGAKTSPAKGHQSLSAIHWAASCGHDNVVKLLLDKKCGPNNQTLNTRETPLRFAAGAGHESTVRIIIDSLKGALNKNNSGASALWGASANGHRGVVQLLLERRVYFDTQNRRTGGAALYMAVKGGYTLIVSDLLCKGCNPNIQKHNLKTPLHKAAEFGHIEIARLLLDHGAKVDVPDANGETALFWAVKMNQQEVVSFLCSEGADIFSKNDSGESVIGYANEYSCNFVPQTLAEYIPQDPEIQDESEDDDDESEDDDENEDDDEIEEQQEQEQDDDDDDDDDAGDSN